MKGEDFKSCEECRVLRLQTVCETFDISNTTVYLDEDGFMLNEEVWTENIAHELAKRVFRPITLTEEHLEVVRFFHQYYQDHNTLPSLALLNKNFTYNKIRKLFAPLSFISLAIISGSPNPLRLIEEKKQRIQTLQQEQKSLLTEQEEILEKNKSLLQEQTRLREEIQDQCKRKDRDS